jgi:hypothetical protein
MRAAAAGGFTGTWCGVVVLAIAKRSPDMELRSLDFSPIAVTQSGLDDFTICIVVSRATFLYLVKARLPPC